MKRMRAALALFSFMLMTNGLKAQPQAEVPAEAVVIVEGTVRSWFQNAQRGRPDALVELDVRKAELGPAPVATARVGMPRPGQLLYVHVRALPANSSVPEGQNVRVPLTHGENGGWWAVDESWLKGPEATPGREPRLPAPSDANPPGGSRETSPSAAAALDRLGMTAEVQEIQGRIAIKVTGTQRQGPAQRAGLEPGDLIVGIDGKPIADIEAAAQRVLKGGQTTAMVVDVNTGRVAQVQVDLGDAPARVPPSRPSPSPEATPAPAPAPSVARRSLGISAEPVAVGQRTALKVSRVEPNSPGAKAGLEPGDVIVEANGAPITGVEQLASALRKSGPTMNLMVRDTRTGREVPVKVELGGEEMKLPPDLPAPTPRPGGSGSGGSGTAGALGAVTELVFLDTEAAVKVTEVAPNSPAARAGLKPGDIIVEAGGTPVLHPNELTEAVRNAGARIQLTVLDSRTGRRAPVQVNLGNR